MNKEKLENLIIDKEKINNLKEYVVVKGCSSYYKIKVNAKDIAIVKATIQN
jgi:hypothetical protein